ncbi:hypothetical protein P7K49_011978 [Saguinus oedipus]|uniref:Uncharacterized protein n=1 Tax=Saguinus oedipus TaxID=9490 RepID=A0ABQ9VS78_SAGOE|nr:hypothetical protein P7K49_011978 [Saguinus oedipus]
MDPGWERLQQPILLPLSTGQVQPREPGEPSVQSLTSCHCSQPFLALHAAALSSLPLALKHLKEAYLSTQASHLTTEMTSRITETSLVQSSRMGLLRTVCSAAQSKANVTFLRETPQQAQRRMDTGCPGTFRASHRDDPGDNLAKGPQTTASASASGPAGSAQHDSPTSYRPTPPHPAPHTPSPLCSQRPHFFWKARSSLGSRMFSSGSQLLCLQGRGQGSMRRQADDRGFAK